MLLGHRVFSVTTSSMILAGQAAQGRQGRQGSSSARMHRLPAVIHFIE